jgi:hypothetical protein
MNLEGYNENNNYRISNTIIKTITSS